ncbi:MAG: 2-succinyl-5-enolpyruvyl-6-hydroxy-3-cyclohexene-carboxylate synthase [Acidimicrobiaceae bacterium]|jgi:2-succinyl-5-enolpyruvyl-6-hydroxy-3-cyclohexene-1-carboxylate synthase|nr:2-succinyl-5-enolpyruvyl-6-hydroxy-3-cyclohexene-carboxylate synthase [Acidimicrobiaceae bacterium]
MTVQATFAATLVDEWVRSGVTDAVVSPGSRSTPLALAVAAHPGVVVHVVLDERSAGFFALGLGLSTGRPAVVVTTSGTAAVELHPAVVEADLACVPMLVCTADRPPELHHVGAAQTVEQRLLFIGAARWAVEPGVPDQAAAHTWRSLASRAHAEATVRPGPVHLNLAFRDPLVGEPGDLPPGRSGGRAWHQVSPAASTSVAVAVPEGARGVIVAGAGAGDPSAVHGLAQAMGWPVLADPRSGCRLPRPNTVAAADAILRARPYRPDFVLRVGAPWASKVLNEWLAGLDAEQWLVDEHGQWRDPERVVHRLLPCLPGPSDVPAPADWLEEWADAEALAQQAIEDTAVGEPAIARNLMRDLPAGSNLVVSSSMPIRDIEWYAEPRDGVRVFANRGANGIDGVLSTALGIAAGSPETKTVALVGDLAFLHDVGALALAARRPDVDCTFLVVDNGGGGIFSFLPQATSLPPATFEALFGTPHTLNIEAIAHAFGTPNVQVLKSDRSDNVSDHSRIHAAVAAVLTS